MHNLPFDKPGRFYRGNLHTHSTRSDGLLDPAAVVAAYRERGYDFLAITDHFWAQYGFPVTDTRALRDATFTTLLGAELHAPRLANGAEWHILAVGLPLDFAPTAEGETAPMLAARAAAAGAFVAIAHPHELGATIDDALSVAAAHGVEIFNQTCVYYSDRANGWYVSDLLSARGERHVVYAADDAHFGDRPDRFAAWVQVRADRLDPDGLLVALKAGHFYSSQGPEIHEVAVVGDTLRVACSPARAIIVSGREPLAVPCVGDGLTEHIVPLAAFRGGYCRVTVIDAAGKRAWSNPIWLD